ncbi:MAG: cytochrome c [Candidatus Promineifilaceae bacterium]|nr:cytochrome c [Candidatus Promineifilaceae bacterium]
MKELGIVVLVCLLAGCANSTVAPTKPALVDNLPSIGELAGTPEAELPEPPTLDAALVARGQQLYAVHCASCHGAKLEGEADWQQPNADGSFRAPPHDATGHTWHHGDALLLETIRLGGERLPAEIGTSAMPAFSGTLTVDEMDAILTYFKSSWPADIRAAQWEMTVRSQANP